eukprot:15465851-Alexandrium_andersonii.AAC.1
MRSYLARVLATAARERVGVAWRRGGRAARGLLVSAEVKARAAEDEPPAMWHMKAALPQAVTDAQLEAALTSAGWREVQ